LSDDADAIESVGGVYLVQIDQSHDPWVPLVLFEEQLDDGRFSL
jgi:hypothetical protein